MEVGAMLVGRIVNYKEAGEAAPWARKRACFQYGGSTIILLTEKGDSVRYGKIF